MSSFSELLALSRTQTQEQQSTVQRALAERQRKEEARRRQQAEQEAKERELAMKLRLKHFEDQRKERERQERMEEVKQAQAAALKRREENMKNALLFGPKKAKSLSSTPDGSSPKWPSSASQNRVRSEVRKQRVPQDGAGKDGDESAQEFLTREEKRERKRQLEMSRIFHSSKRTSAMASHSRGKRCLPGGAVDVTTTARFAGGDTALSNKSVKERLAAMPNTLTKLNTVKRDTRTIDEILQDRAKARDSKVLDGDEARVFDDWFGSKKKEAKKPSSSQDRPSAAPSGANTPASTGSKTGTPTPQSLNPKKTLVSTKSTSSLPKINKSIHSVKPNTKVVPLRSALLDNCESPSSNKTSRSLGSSSSLAAKKRPRSPSLSPSPPPPKRQQHGVDENIRNEIWRLFHKDRTSYVSQDVFSDDEDMEADAVALEREEKESARIAKREDDLALAEERRREEEKRKRKMMRDWD